MRVHHFYPKTDNVGDHFVQEGIARMIREIVPDVTFDLFNVNSRGRDGAEYGLTQSTIERANCEADVVVVGGSNLYEGSWRWDWGVHLELDALKNLRVPLFTSGPRHRLWFSLTPAPAIATSNRVSTFAQSNRHLFRGARCAYAGLVTLPRCFQRRAWENGPDTRDRYVCRGD